MTSDDWLAIASAVGAGLLGLGLFVVGIKAWREQRRGQR